MKTSVVRHASFQAFHTFKPLKIILSISIFLSFSSVSRSQEYRGAAQQMYFYTQPSARMEGMGRVSAALTGSPANATPDYGLYIPEAGKCQVYSLNINYML